MSGGASHPGKKPTPPRPVGSLEGYMFPVGQLRCRGPPGLLYTSSSEKDTRISGPLFCFVCVYVGTLGHSVNLVKPVDFSPEMCIFNQKAFFGGLSESG